MVNYIDLFSKSWNGLKNNLVLFLPYLISLGLAILFFIILLIEAGIFIYAYGIEFNAITYTQAIDLMQNTGLMVYLIFFLIIDIIVWFLVNVYINSMYIGMCKEIMKNGKTNTSTMFQSGKIYYKRILGVKIIKFLITSIPLLILILINLAIYLYINKILTLFTGLISLILFFVYALAISVGFFFVSPTIAEKSGKVLDLVKESFNYAKKNLGHTIITLLILVGIGLVIGIIFQIPITTIDNSLPMFSDNRAVAMILITLLVLFNIIKVIIQASYALIVNLYVFFAYYPNSTNNSSNISRSKPKSSKSKSRK
ncbi:MAG: glycerophosphoryl diester phosphodiesterase membrane domain-containing protein [Candidatus Woesearchaeota archaeon]